MVVLDRNQARLEGWQVVDVRPVALASPGYAFTSPVFVRVTREDEAIVAIAEQLGAYGAGQTEADALDDLATMLIDDYEDLAASESILSEHLAARLATLRKLIVKH